MATATKPQGAEAERLIFDWQNPAKFQVLFKIADDLREARERASLAWRNWRDTKYPRYGRSAGDWSEELPDDDERVANAKRSAKMAAETVRQFENDLGEWLGELREIRAYLRENAPQLEYLVPLVRPGIAPPAESFEAMAERMVKLAGELMAMENGDKADTPATTIIEMWPDDFPRFDSLRRFLSKHPEIPVRNEGRRKWVSVAGVAKALAAKKKADVRNAEVVAEAMLEGIEQRKAEVDARKDARK